MQQLARLPNSRTDHVSFFGPKPNFIGVGHRGRNLFANCLIAIDVRTGQRLWHFQEIRHDLWDLDIPAPPLLATITREGRRVDVVAACTKIGTRRKRRPARGRVAVA